jgi:hypothetical protein
VTGPTFFEVACIVFESRFPEEEAMAKKVLLGIVGVSVVALGYWLIAGRPPSQEGAEGTIQAAKRYHTDQIASQDVIVKDPEIQALLQTDFFHRVVTDKSFQKMVADGSLQRLEMRSRRTT